MGKYIKKFDTHSDYEDFIETEDFIRPNVSYCVDNKDVHYNSTQTLFAVEFESGKFAFGHASEDEIFVATRDGLAQIWYADANGVITGYTPTADNVASAIIDAYNEHFGTGINIWTPETINLQVGDTVPNWNAYEKIKLPPIMLYKYKNPVNSVWFFGEVENANAKIYGEDENTYFVLNDAGSIIGKNSANVDTLKEEIKSAIEAKISESLQTISIVSTDYQIGNNVDKWNEYEIV